MTESIEVHSMTGESLVTIESHVRCKCDWKTFPLSFTFLEIRLFLDREAKKQSDMQGFTNSPGFVYAYMPS